MSSAATFLPPWFRAGRHRAQRSAFRGLAVAERSEVGAPGVDFTPGFSKLLNSHFLSL